MTPSRGSILAVLAACLCLALPGSAQGPAPSPSGASAAILKNALTSAYNLDHDEAVALARRAIALDPENPRMHRGLAAILWLHILFNRGAVTIDHYMGSISRSNLTLPKPDAAIAAEFKQAITRATTLANARLEANPRDVQARYDAGAAYGLHASYVASVEGSMTSAFSIARRAYSAQEEVLEREPSRVSAGVIVGTYRYVISTLNPMMRMFAFVAGMGSGKEEGIALLEAAARDPEARVDASAVLMLIYSREGRHAEVVRIAHALGTEFPRNRLFQLEEGAAAIRAGLAGDANAVLTRGIEALKLDTRPRFPSEEAIWHYKRGLARLNLNQQPAAAADLQYALGAKPSEWFRGKIQLEVGKLADLASHRPDAVAAYQTAARLCKASADSMCEKEANRYLKKAFSFSGR